MTFQKGFIFIAALFIATPSFAQRGRTTAPTSASDFKPTGINGSAGFGFAHWTILDPESANFRFDQTQFAGISAERGFGILNLYLNLSLGYLKGTGQVNYHYETLSQEIYTATDVNYTMELFQAGLGLKFKLIDGFWFRPYVEGGGYGGWFQIKYNNLSDRLQQAGNTGTNYKASDTLLDFGRYGEAGVEVDFSGTFGLRPAARFVTSETKKLLTLNNKVLRYEAAVYYLALLIKF